MKQLTYKLGLLLGGLSLLYIVLVGSGWSGRLPRFDADTAPTVPSFTCSCGIMQPMTLNGTVPGDQPLIGAQIDADCFAWQEFIALNWPTQPTNGLGNPGTLTPVQWETYMRQETLFPANGSAPPKWGTTAVLPPQLKSFARSIPAGVKVLTATNKFVDSSVVITGTGEAFPDNSFNWLGAQNKTNVWYEVLINQDEYNYVVNNQFYDANKQAAWVAQNKPIVLPEGTSSGTVGALELKAAWMEVPDVKNPKWQRYKLSPAVVFDTRTSSPRSVTVALVGLHILHKTQSQPTWLWATFEHVDNLPGAPRSQAPYNFYNASCQPQAVTVPSGCSTVTGKPTVTVGCTPNTPPPYNLCPGGPRPVPIQVSRVVPIDNNAQQANRILQKAIASAFPKSVFQNYQLVNVIWSTNPLPDPTVPVPTPVNPRSMLPTVNVANVTLETYAQNMTCTSCHKYATIAPTAGSPNPTLSSDFSFALGSAQPAGKTMKLARLITLKK